MSAASEANPSLQVDSAGYDATGHQKNVLSHFTNIQTDSGVTPNVIHGDQVVSTAVGSALAPWSSQPTQTAAAAADTVLKWGSGGTTPFNHLEMMNNGTVNFLYALDADSTAGTAKVYTIAAGQHVFIDRAGSTLHCNSASQLTFGGSTGITIEAFA